MAYTVPNFRTKKAFLNALASGPVAVYQPGPFGHVPDGITCLEGPHFPEPHRWYARVEVRAGYVVRALK